jgi:hypothetical protein
MAPTVSSDKTRQTSESQMIAEIKKNFCLKRKTLHLSDLAEDAYLPAVPGFENSWGDKSRNIRCSRRVHWSLFAQREQIRNKGETGLARSVAVHFFLVVFGLPGLLSFLANASNSSNGM